jgi:hypothetical protein
MTMLSHRPLRRRGHQGRVDRGLEWGPPRALGRRLADREAVASPAIAPASASRAQTPAAPALATGWPSGHLSVFTTRYAIHDDQDDQDD